MNKIQKKGSIFAFASIISCTHITAQEISTQGKKYANAFTKYLNATCPITKDSIGHFVYFSGDRDAIIDHPFLKLPLLKGAQIMYAWKQFEPEKGRYDFSMVRKDYDYLKRYHKKIFVQLQDATFGPNDKAVPDYLLTAEYDGGAVQQYDDDGKPFGWVAKRWNKKVRERLALLLEAFGKEFDGKIEGINLQETSIGVSTQTDSSFSDQEYLIGIKENMLALKKAFRISTTMIYANFMPGEWLPSDDKGYLSSIYQYGEKIGVGLGGPDLMVTRKAQLNHAYTLMHERHYTVPIGIAVQDGNYIEMTGADPDYNKNNSGEKKSRKNIVPLLYAFAKDFLRVRYMFWVNQEPYFTKDVIPCFATE